MTGLGAPGDDALDLEMLTASLRADASDIDTFFEVFGTKMHEALGDRVILERGKGHFRRDPKVHRILVKLGDRELDASREPNAGSSISFVVRHSVRGVVLRSDEVDFEKWFAALGAALGDEARSSAATRAALQSLLG